MTFNAYEWDFSAGKSQLVNGLSSDPYNPLSSLYEVGIH